MQKHKRYVWDYRPLLYTSSLVSVLSTLNSKYAASVAWVRVERQVIQMRDVYNK